MDHRVDWLHCAAGHGMGKGNDCSDGRGRNSDSRGGSVSSTIVLVVLAAEEEEEEHQQNKYHHQQQE